MIVINMFCSGHWLTRTLSIPGEKGYPLVESDEETECVLLCICVSLSRVLLWDVQKHACPGRVSSEWGWRQDTYHSSWGCRSSSTADLAEDGMAQECDLYKATQVQRLQRGW